LRHPSSARHPRSRTRRERGPWRAMTQAKSIHHQQILWTISHFQKNLGEFAFRYRNKILQ
jgi:hypothetical protein